MKSISELQDDKTKLIQTKIGLMSKMTQVRENLVTTLPQHLYQEVERQRLKLVKDLQKVDLALSEVKSEIRKLSAPTPPVEKSVIQQFPTRMLIELRDEYQAFAADGTRSPTMRRMASEFVMKVTPIIRKALRKTNEEE